MQKVIVAGSRTFHDYGYLAKELDVRIPPFIEEIVCGNADGPDKFGAKWAEEHGYPVKHFPAQWDKYGKAAGIIRNHEMGDYADSLIAFWDGKSPGTRDMIEYMRKQNKYVEVVNSNTMKISILGPWNFDRLSAVMEELITESQCFLFTVVCGGTNEEGLRDTVGYKWAIANGAPVEYLVQEDVNKLIDRLTKDIDFVIVANDGNPIIKKIIMKMSMLGKHGRVEEV